MQVEKISPAQFSELKQIAASIRSHHSVKNSVDMDFVERLLGRKQGQNLTRSTSKRLKRICGDIFACIRPGISYDILPIQKIVNGKITLANGLIFESRKMARSIEGASWLVCFVATIGSEIDRRIEHLMNQGKMADAYVADTVGSGAIEYIADNFHKGLQEKLSARNQSVSLRFSPGYCDWPVTEQRKLFSLLDNESVGVELGETFLMTPRKSISATFAVFDSRDAVAHSLQNPCMSCWKKDCIARRVEAVTPSH